MKGTFKVYGQIGHSNKESFEPSFTWDFSNDADGIRVIHVANGDETGNYDFVELTIERDTRYLVYKELCGQLSDGLFENIRTEEVTEIRNGEETVINPWDEANKERVK